MATKWIAVLTFALLAGGCDTLSKGPYAVADVKGLQNGPAWGRVTFHQAEGGTFIGETVGWSAPVATAAANAAAGRTFIRADINGLPPNSQFGFHVHEKPDCTGDGSGAGGHFNPQGKPHARYDSAERHAGDLPNLTSNGEGVAVFAFTTETLTVAPGPNSVVGRSVIIHASPDDFRAQPAGNSGARIACGVIRGE